MKTRFLYFKFVVILCSLVFHTGCVNLETVKRFSEGAHALSIASGKFYAMELEQDRQLAAMTVDLGSPTKSVHCKTPSGQYLTPWDCATKGRNLMAEARRNRVAVAALAQYAGSLNEIATFSDDENIEKASQELSGNLSHLASTLDESVDPNTEVLASAISELAKIYLGLKARKIIFEKIKKAQPHVEVVINTLRKDIKRQQQRLDISRLSAKATREEWFNAFRNRYNTPVAPESEKAFLSIAAGKLVADDLKDELSVLPSKMFLEELDDTAKKCLTAHQAIQNPDLSDQAAAVVQFVNDARGLLTSISQLGN